MLFNSIDFLMFFPVALVVYFLCPQKIRYIWLLICSYYFYMGWNPVYAILLLFSTTITYICGFILEIIKNKSWEEKKKIRYKKFWLVVSVILNLGILAYFKYANFFVEIMAAVARQFGVDINFTEFDILLPVGISFYIFQALGYAVDVYREEIYAEKNFLKYALFVSFFPQLVAGPIERSKNLLVQLNKPQRFSMDNLIKGSIIMLYGFFLKMVIADRAAIMVNTVYNNWPSYPGLYIVIATVLFAIQIYCDFYGYSTIAKGAALTMGIKLMDNFNAPYFSKSIKEFWRRWHISLSGWFRDYLYIPLGGNRKGVVKKNLNLMITFLLSGLWHGAGVNYITWGGLNGAFQVLADIRDGVKAWLCKKLGISPKKEKKAITSQITSQLVTFCCICFTWLFFRADGMDEAIQMLVSICTDFNWWILLDDSIFTLGITRQYFGMFLFAVIILFVVDYYKYKGHDITESFFRQPLLFQVVATVFLITTIILFGCYGDMYDASAFIYFQF